ncbi:ABC transporter ATP-binding protein [Ketobacter alkanivorans]|uniref:Copper ABC transporter ATP-binding protein n=1 Tax=Ketobacter alkanivorans TaxID=1917421 RepID=A0A2K9LNS5_9GAMM|nr:ABC transporter ATP-binding protein [Ketobacter alkanivorans]AUM12454.1 copper ABC transporter ATP-binding protein [Ketobacter alkanivorans]
MTLVQLDQVHKSFGNVQALQGISLRLGPGEVLGLFGHNGAGKTTTMKLILGLEQPSQGDVSVFGLQPSQPHFSQQRFSIGFLPENVAFYPQLTGREVLRYFGRLKRVSPQRCSALLDRIGLAHAADRKVKTYSKGMRQRLGLAQALLSEPKLLLLDEPTVGLDPIATQDFYSMVDELRGQGCGVILCSHVLPGVEQHIDRAAILGNGQVRALGSLSQLRQQANLPMSIRVKSTLARNQLQQELDSLTTLAKGMRPINGSTLEWESDPSNKMQLLRALTQNPHIDDIEFQQPSLEKLYRYFVEDHDEVTPQ